MEEIMKAQLYLAGLRTTRIDRNHVRLALAIGTLFLMAIGAAAPGTSATSKRVSWLSTG